MRIIGAFALSFLLSASAGADLCSYEKRFQDFPEMTTTDFNAFLYLGQSVDQILVSKQKKKIYLLSGSKVVKSYPTAFGRSPGKKHFDGDEKTPEGIYYIDSKNPESAYHLSLKISYPNAVDLAFAKKNGRNPGGDIMIHGFPENPVSRAFVRAIHPKDWTQGCIAVTDRQIEEIYQLVPMRTPVTICP